MGRFEEERLKKGRNGAKIKNVRMHLKVSYKTNYLFLDLISEMFNRSIENGQSSNDIIKKNLVKVGKRLKTSKFRCNMEEKTRKKSERGSKTGF